MIMQMQSYSKQIIWVIKNNPIKDIAVRRNIPYGYIGDVTALELVEKSVFEELERLGCSL